MQTAETDRNLVISPFLETEQVDDQAATIYLRSSGSRIRIPKALYDVLRRFSSSRTLPDALGTTSPPASLVAALEKLQGKGFLIFEDELESVMLDRLVTAPPIPIFDAPMQKPDDPPSDVVVIGFPYDHGCFHAAGARAGTLALREASLHLLYRVSSETGRPLGWYDADRREPMLKGTSIADCGDLVVDHGESRSQMNRRFDRLLDKVIHENTLPVLIGGDATGSYSLIRHIQKTRRVAIVRIGGPAGDGSASRNDAVSTESPGESLLELEETEGYWNIAASSVRAEGPGHTHSKFHTIPSADANTGLVADIRSRVPDGTAIYLGIDIGVLDRGLTNDASRECEALRFEELKALIVALGENFEIHGLDLVGMNPSRPYWSVMSVYALHILVTAIGAAKDSAGLQG